MRVMEKYARLRDGNWYVGDSRVSVYSVISAWRRHRDRAPERIQQSYPSLPLVAIYATIAYYLEYQAELDAFFDEVRAQTARRRAEAEAVDPGFYKDMRERFARFTTPA